MPRSKAVPSLRGVCLTLIAQEFEYWAKDYVEDYFKKGEVPLYIVGPFDEWTTELTQELLDTLICNKVARSYQLHLLIHSRIESLDLSNWSQHVKDDVASIIASRCFKLRSLVLNNCNRIKPRALADMLQSLPKLRRLDLSGTRVTDQVLTVLGYSCPHIVDLSLKDTAITDSGLAALNKNPSNGNPGCRFLKKLDISGIAVQGHDRSWNGVRIGGTYSLSYKELASLVSYCEDLEVLHSEDTYGAIKMLHITEPSTPGSKLKQVKIHIGESEEKLIDLQKLFPLIVDVILEGHYRCEELLSLVECQHLRRLSLHTDQKYTHTLDALAEDEQMFFFNKGVGPLLESIGARLTHLSLHHVPCVHVSTIAKFCTNLQKLSLEFLDMLHFTDAPSLVKPLNTLRSFECINSNPDSPLCLTTVSAICSLLSLAISLESLHLVYLLGLKDHHIRSVFETNAMSALKTVSFLNCPDISPKVIDELVYSENVIEKLSIIDCRQIYLCKAWMKYCQTENKALVIDFVAPPFLF